MNTSIFHGFTFCVYWEWFWQKPYNHNEHIHFPCLDSLCLLIIEDEHHHAVHAFISCSWIHNMLIPESITGISCFMFRPKPSQRLPTLHGRALHGFHFHHHVSPGLIPCNYGKNHAVHGTCHGSAWSLCQTQKKVKSWHVIKSLSL